MSDFRLKVFRSVAKNLSFTKASQELFVSQPAITKHIQELEAAYQTRLFDRQGSRISLTESGNLLLEHCERILEDYKRLEYEMHLLHNEYPGGLKLGASTTIAQYVLPPLLASFIGKFPQVSLSLLNGNSREIEAALQEHRIDLGFVEGVFRLPNIRYTTFLEDGYKRLMKWSLLRKFKVVPYIQYVVAYHLRLFLLEGNREVVMEMVPEEEMQAFKDRLSNVLQKVSDEVICSMNTALPVIEMELSLKYKKKVRAKKTITDNDMVFQYGEKQLARLSERNVRVIGIMDKPGYEGMLRGRFSTPLYAMKKDDYIFVQNGDEKIKTDRYKCKKQLYILDELMRNYKNAGFVVRIPEEWKEIQFGIHTNDVDILLNKVEVNSEDKQENEDE